MRDASYYNNIKNPLNYLDDIDLLLLQGDATAAAREFLNLLTLLGHDWYNTDCVPSDFHGSALAANAQICERAAAQWHRILASDINMTQFNIAPVVLFMPVLHALLMGSYQGNLDSFIKSQHRRCNGNYGVQELLRLLLAWCPTSRVDLNVFAYIKQAPALVTAHAIATIADMAMVSTVASRAQKRAVELLADAEALDLDDMCRFGISVSVNEAWMRCSYIDHPRKHEVKRFLTALIVRVIDNVYGNKPPAGQLLSLDKPRHKPLMVIPLETFKSKHAMYRCYADVLLQFRPYFHTVGLAMPDSYDDMTVALFDEFVDVAELTGWVQGDPVDIRNIAASITQWQADVLFYPSIGMAQWVIELAHKRLAPLQVMSMGHPATSMLDEIDYLMVEGVYVGDERCYTEKVIGLPSPAASYRLPHRADSVKPLPGLSSDGVIRIAVPSVAQKVTAEFVAALRDVQQRSTRTLEFVFFLGIRSVQQVACTMMLQRELRNVVCHGYIAYKDYIEELNRCQLHAGTFPFGGTNSLIDSLRQRLPILALEGNEVHARIDSDFLRRAGLPESLVCHSPRQYSDRMLELVENPEQLQQLRQQLENVDVDAVFFGEGKPESFARALAAQMNIQPSVQE